MQKVEPTNITYPTQEKTQKSGKIGPQNQLCWKICCENCDGREYLKISQHLQLQFGPQIIIPLVEYGAKIKPKQNKDINLDV